MRGFDEVNAAMKPTEARTRMRPEKSEAGSNASHRPQSRLATMARHDPLGQRAVRGEYC